MENVEMVYRDYSRVDNADNDSRKVEDRQVKLTGQSDSIIEKKFEEAIQNLNDKKQQVKNQMINIENKINNLDYDKDAINIERLRVRLVKLSEQKFKLSRKVEKTYKALKVVESMHRNMNRRLSKIFSKINVKKVNTQNIADMVEKGFQQRTSETKEKSGENMDYNDIRNMVESQFNNDGSTHSSQIEKNVQDGLTSISENSDYSLPLSSQYNVSKKNIIQDDLSISDDEYNFNNDINKANESNFQSEFDTPSSFDETEEVTLTDDDSQEKLDIEQPKDYTIPTTIASDIEGSINSDIFKNNDSEENYAGKEADIYRTVASSLENNTTTIDDLELLRQALEAEKVRQNQLQKTLEAEQMAASNAAKEARQAEQEKNEKIKQANKRLQEQLQQCRKENEEIVSQTGAVVKERQESISMREQAIASIASIDAMIMEGEKRSKIANSRKIGK